MALFLAAFLLLVLGAAAGSASELSLPNVAPPRPYGSETRGERKLLSSSISGPSSLLLVASPSFIALPVCILPVVLPKKKFCNAECGNS